MGGAVTDGLEVAAIHRRIAALGPSIGTEVREATLEMYTSMHPSEQPHRIVRDVAYGPDPRHLLDLHLPIDASAATTPVLVFVHGGGFVGGDKGGPGRPLYDNIGRFAAERGWLGVTMNYRLAPTSTWPSGAEDVQLALQFLSSVVVNYGGDANSMAIFGHSAGAAHVATFLADQQRRSSVTGLRAAVLSSGIYEPEILREQNVGAYYGDNRTELALRSCVEGLSLCDVPFQLLVAEFDPPDFHRQAACLLASFVNWNGRFPAFSIGRGHNHFSSSAHYGTADNELSGEVARFLAGALG
jgi:acetyl esterase/lipase